MLTNPKKALVIGLGASGITAVRFLCSHGYTVKVADTRDNPPNLAVLQEEMPKVEFCGGRVGADLLTDEGIVVFSPGISPHHSEAAALAGEAKARGIEVIGEIELFARYLNYLKQTRNYRPVIVGITGTNGKTTTTKLTAAIVEESGLKVCCAGNVGPNALAELVKLEKENSLPDVWVLELSSFQLDTTTSLVCDCAALLNVTEDHIDWHGSFEEYAKAKYRIFSPTTIRVLNRADLNSKKAAEGIDPKLIRTFGIKAPTKAGEFGLSREGMLGCLAYFSEKTGKVETIIPENALLIRGTHNKQNALAASALAMAIGIDPDAVKRALSSYRGEPHRVQTVLVANDIEYVDDSKGTNVGATVAAIKGFDGRRIVIILGGDGKGQDFSALTEAVRDYCRGVVLIGRDAALIEDVLRDTDVPILHAYNMAQAVSKCREMARSGDVILLSPACASWDMFKDYADRSEQFIESVKEVARREGFPC